MPEHELEPRMRALEVGQATLTTAVEANTQVMTAIVTKHDKTIYGTDENPGLITRLDREEQNTVRQKRSFWLVLSAMIGIVGKFIYDSVSFFFSHPH